MSNNESKHIDTDGDNAGQFLTFSLAGEEYGVDILQVQEIKGYSKTTRVPNSPPEVVGVLNLRGTIVPVVDLRRKFSLPECEHDAFAAIVVVLVGGRVVGLLVDRVSEVVSIPRDDIQPQAEYGSSSSTTFVQGLGKMGDRLVILLDVATIIGNSELQEAA